MVSDGKLPDWSVDLTREHRKFYLDPAAAEHIQQQFEGKLRAAYLEREHDMLDAVGRGNLRLGSTYWAFSSAEGILQGFTEANRLDFTPEELMESERRQAWAHS